MYQTTITERTELAQELAPLVKDLLSKQSKQVTDVEEVTSTAYVTTLPALYVAGGIKKTVRVALSTLVDEAATKADNLVVAATNAANTAASKANTAADTADHATAQANAATANADTATAKANTAAANADTATNAANTAASKANTAADTADHATAQANAATANADTATAKANTAAANADTATNAANTAASKAQDVVDAASKQTQLNLIPTAVTVSAPGYLMLADTEPQRIAVTMTPASVMPNVIYQTNDADIISVRPDGRVIPKAAGLATVYVIPTCNTALYKAVQINVVEASLRMHSDTAFRFDASGNFIFN